MAKSDSFFIRASTTFPAGAGSFDQTEIDLGSFVNLGVSKSTLLRIWNIQVQWSDDTGVEHMIYSSAAVPGGSASWQLTTQTQTALVLATDKSLVASGKLNCYSDPTSTAHSQQVTEVQDINPARWKNGYLIGVDSIFLGADGSNTITSGAGSVAIVMECTLETATQASSTALALSQQ